MAVKRRIIWMTDEEWAILTQEAKARHETISGIIRAMWITAASAGPVARAMTQGERDAILRRANRREG